MKTRFLFNLLLLAFTCTTYAQNGCKIKLDVNGLSDTIVVLGNYFATESLYPADTFFLDQQGKARIERDAPFNQGLYFLYFPNGNIVHFVMGEDQAFDIRIDTVNIRTSITIKGSVENTVFLEIDRELNKVQADIQELQNQLADTSLSSSEKESLSAEGTHLYNVRRTMIDSLYQYEPELFTSIFLKATLNVEVPDSLLTDRQKGYHYLKDHYFDYFDLADPRLLYSPLYDQKINSYLDQMVAQIPDSLIKEVAYIIEQSKADSNTFQHAVSSLFSKYGKDDHMGMDAVQLFIAEKYYIPYSWWLGEESKTKIVKWVNTNKPLLLGQPAPNVELRAVPTEHFVQAAKDTAIKKYIHAGNNLHINDLQADYIVLYFWSPSCSHCKKAVPKFYKVVQEDLTDYNVEVLAICTLSGVDGKEKWVDFVNKYHLYDWINAWNPYDYSYKVTYDINTTPQLYVLNKDHEIIAKKIDHENLAEIFKAYKEIELLRAEKP